MAAVYIVYIIDLRNGRYSVEQYLYSCETWSCMHVADAARTCLAEECAVIFHVVPPVGPISVCCFDSLSFIEALRSISSDDFHEICMPYWSMTGWNAFSVSICVLFSTHWQVGRVICDLRFQCYSRVKFITLRGDVKTGKLQSVACFEGCLGRADLPQIWRMLFAICCLMTDDRSWQQMSYKLVFASDCQHNSCRFNSDSGAFYFVHVVVIVGRLKTSHSTVFTSSSGTCSSTDSWRSS